MFIKKRIFLPLILIALPCALYAWGDGDKLSNGSCKFDLETGYLNSSFYIKDNESFLIMNGGDSRYGTISTIYNASTCEKITSGDSIKSNFSGLMLKRGFEKIDVSNSSKTMDKSFQNIVIFLGSQDDIKVNVKPIDHATSTELNSLLKSLSDKSSNSQINISSSAQKLLSNKRFYNEYLNEINSLRAKNINYEYALALNTILQNNSSIESAILNKLFNLKVKNIKDVPQWAEYMTQLGKQGLISSFRPNIMELSDFAKNLNPNNYLTSIEYKYIFKDSKLTNVGEITNNDGNYGIYLKYPNKTIRLTQKPTCNATGRVTTSEFSCGFLWGNTCVGTYKHFKCNGSTSNIAQIEKQLMGTTKVATALNKGWSYKNMISRYTKSRPNYSSSSSTSVSSSSASSSSSSGSSSSVSTSSSSEKPKGVKKTYAHGKGGHGQTYHAIICYNGRERRGNWQRDDGLWVSFGTLAGHRNQSLSQYAQDFCK